MKGFLLLLCMVLMIACGLNWMQINGLKQDIYRLEMKVDLEHEARTADSPIGLARTALDQVQDALKNTDWKQAQAKLDDAKRRVEEASKSASDRTKPGIEWLQTQVQDLTKQVKDRVGSK